MAPILALFLAALGPAPTPDGPTASTPARGPEAFPFPPEHEAAAEAIWQALQTRKPGPETLEAARRLVRALPRHPRAQRLLGIVAALADQRDEALTALTRSLDLGIDGPRRADVLTMRARLRLQKDFVGQAREDAEAALAIEGDQPDALFVAAVGALRAGDLTAGRDRALRLTKAAPEMAVGHAFLAFALAQDDPDAALAAVRRARALGYPEGTDLRSVEDVARRARLVRFAWQVPLALAAVLAIGLFILFVAGTLLSRAQVAHLASVTAHLERGEQTPGERLVLRLYASVLWFGTIFFYASVPAMVLISLATGLWALYAIFSWMSAIPLKLVLLLLLLALGGAWAVLRSLFLRARADESGMRLVERDEPRLFAALREVAEVARSRVVDRVHLEPDATVAVREAGSAWRVLSGRGERVLHLGFQAVQSLSANELKAVLAHEYGHFSHGDTRLTPVLSRIQETLAHTLVRMAALGYVSLANPVFWYLRLYFHLFTSVTAGHSRRRELLADRAAALAYGGDAFGRALRGVIAAGDTFDRHAGRTLVLLRRTGRPCDDVYRCVADAREAESARLREKRLGEQLSRAASEFDSHPPPQDRIARVAGVPGARAADSAPALLLFADAPATAKRLTEALCSRIEQGLGAQEALPPRDRSMDPGAQALFAAGFAQHVDALELQDSGDVEGDGLLIASVERLSAVLGRDELLLVPALQSLARTQHRLGRGSDAVAAVERAQSILAAQPRKYQAEEKELAALLEEVRPAA